VAILSSLPEGTWDYLSGTSMAAPHVSGVAALLIQARPSAPLTDIVNAIYSTARHPGSSEKRRDSRFGRGLIDPSGALEEIVK
jgi:subtilisin family serine protease